MDCNARFEGAAYWNHTTCVSEAERYQGSLYVPKENKGEAKQAAWSSAVQSRVEQATSKLRPYADKLLAYDNVPRKRAKFVNFVRNSLNLKSDRDGIAEQLWDLIGAESDAPGANPVPESAQADMPVAHGVVASSSTSLQQEEHSDRNKATATLPLPSGKSDASLENRTSVKRKADADAERHNVPQKPPKPIKWKNIITKELNAAGGSMSQKKLRKAVVAEVCAHPSHASRKAKELKREFDEVLPTFHKYKVVDGRVLLAAGRRSGASQQVNE